MKSVSSRNSAVKNMSVEEYNKLYHEMRERVISNIRTSDFDSGEYRPVPSISRSRSPTSQTVGETTFVDETEVSGKGRDKPKKDKRLSASLSTVKGNQRSMARCEAPKEPKSLDLLNKDNRLSASLPTLNGSQPVCMSRRSMASENDAHSLNDMSTMSEREKKLMKLRLQAIRGQIDTPGVVSGWRLVEMYKNRPEVGDEQFDLAAIMSRLFAKKQTKSRHSSPTRRQRTKATSSDRARQSPSHERQ